MLVVQAFYKNMKRASVDRGWLQNPQAQMFLTTLQMMDHSRVLGVLSKKLVVHTPIGAEKKVKSFLESGSSDSVDMSDPMEFMAKAKSMPVLSLKHTPVITTGILPNASFEWKVRLHGETNTGKTTLSKALCRLSKTILHVLTVDLNSYDASETPGLVLRETIIPVKLKQENKPRYIRFDLEDVGSYIQSRRGYLKCTLQNSLLTFDSYW
jgi:hypothetical protein